jgi:hypothetical protein
MRAAYAEWLRSQGYDEGTVGAQLYRVARVEEHHGDLDDLFDADGLASLVERLRYSVEDERRSRPNPSQIPFVGNIRSNLSAYRTAAVWYGRYRSGAGRPTQPARRSSNPAASVAANEPVQRAQRKQPFIQRPDARTLADFGLNGRAALEAIVAGSQYRTIAQAVASLTMFSHPDTVRQTGGKALFPTIRNQRRVGQFDEYQGLRVLLDDNKSPTDAFRWANGLLGLRGPDTQFNHVYAASLDIDAYTALPNICMTPAFIAKLTDTSEEVGALLRYRSYDLYAWVPRDTAAPEKPVEYDSLDWAAPLPAIADVKAVLTAAMASKPKDRTVIAARELGWLFG